MKKNLKYIKMTYQNKRHIHPWPIITALAMILAMVSCRNENGGLKGILATADSLADVRPDSAATLLEQVEDSMARGDETTRMAYKLVRIKVEDKAKRLYIEEHEITDIVEYYEGKGDKTLLPTAYYYAGRHFAKQHDAPAALGYFYRAYESIGPDSINSFLKGKTCNQIGQLHTRQMLYKDSKAFYEEALLYNTIAKDTIGAIFSLRDIAGSYEMTEQYDSCDFYLHKALQLAQAKPDTTMVRNILCSLTDSHIERGQFDSAKVYIAPLFGHTNPQLESPIYTNASKIYLHEGKIDSALYCINRVLRNGTVEGKKTAYRNLTRIDLMRGDVRAAREHFENYVLYIDSINHIRATEALANAAAAYDYKQKEQENTRLKEENQRKTFMGWILILTCALLLILLVLVRTYYKNRHTKDLARSMALNLSLDRLTQIPSTDDASQQEKTDTRAAQNKDTATTADNDKTALQQEIDILDKKLTQLSEINKRQDSNSQDQMAELQKIFRFYAKHDMSPKDKDWLLLEKALMQACPQLFSDLTQKIQLSLVEERVCWLTKLKLTPSETARVLSKSPQAVTSIRSRLYQKIFNLKGSSRDFDDFVGNL